MRRIVLWVALVLTIAALVCAPCVLVLAGGHPSHPTQPKHPTTVSSANLTDNFNRDDGVLGSHWVSYGAAVNTPDSSKSAIESGVSKVVDASGGGNSRLATGAGVSDYMTQCYVNCGVSGNGGATARHLDCHNFYLAYLNFSGEAALYKRVAGTFTLLSTTSGAGLATTATVKVTVSGTEIKAFHNGVEKLSASDSAITDANSAGMYSDGSGEARIDNFETSGVLQ